MATGKKGNSAPAGEQKQKKPAYEVHIDKTFDDPNKSLRAVASMTIGDFAVHGIKLFQNDNGTFVSMPAIPYKRNQVQRHLPPHYGGSTRRTRQSHCCSLQSGTRNRTDHGADRSSRTNHAADVICHHQTKNQKKKKEVFRYEKVFCQHQIQARFHEEQGSHLRQDRPRLHLR